ncbi:MAG: TRAP transporter substrate-binding protein DctP [Oscillospiraceae bacterium]
MKTKILRALCIPMIIAILLSLAACAGGGTTSGGNTSSGTSTSDAGDSGSSTDATAQKVTWRAQTVEVAGTERYACTENFVNLVSEATGGNFTIELYAADTLYSQAGLIEAVQQGVTEGAFTSSDYHSGIEPMLKLQAYRPSDNWNDFNLDETFFEKIEPLVQEAFDNMGGLVYASTVLDLPGESFHSNKPIHTLADFKGLLIRSGGLGQELYAALGGSIVSMPMGEVYTAAKLGTVDAFEVGGYIDNYQNAFQEVVKYNIEPALHATAGILVGQFLVNEDAWNALPDEYKEVINECAKENREYTFNHLTEKNEEAKQYFTDAGVETITLSDEDVSTAKELAAEAVRGYWGQSELSDEFLTAYVQFLNDNGFEDIAAKVAK